MIIYSIYKKTKEDIIANEQKKYLKWYNKVGYGSGDLAGNIVYAFLSSFLMLYLTNKYYLMICMAYICQQIYSAMLNMGIYYMIYILKNENLYSVFSWAINIPVIIAMCITPMLVEKMNGLYRMNLAGYILGTAGRVGVIFAGYMGSVPLMLAFTAIAALGMAPWQGDMGGSCSKLL